MPTNPHPAERIQRQRPLDASVETYLNRQGHSRPVLGGRSDKGIRIRLPTESTGVQTCLLGFHRRHDIQRDRQHRAGRSAEQPGSAARRFLSSSLVGDVEGEFRVRKIEIDNGEVDSPMLANDVPSRLGEKSRRAVSGPDAATRGRAVVLLLDPHCVEAGSGVSAVYHGEIACR